MLRIVLAGLALICLSGARDPYEDYRDCQTETRLLYGREWEAICVRLGMEPRCGELPSEALTQADRRFRARLHACLDSISPRPGWYTTVQRVIDKESQPAAVFPRENRWRDWFISTVVVCACIIGILDVVRSLRR